MATIQAPSGSPLSNQIIDPNISSVIKITTNAGQTQISNRQKDFYDRITRKGTNKKFRALEDKVAAGNITQAQMNAEVSSNYIGGHIIKRSDLLAMLINNCDALMLCFSYNKDGNVHETNITFHQIVNDGSNNYSVGPDIYTTDEIVPAQPDPTFHCPGPASCNQ